MPGPKKKKQNKRFQKLIIIVFACLCYDTLWKNSPNALLQVPEIPIPAIYSIYGTVPNITWKQLTGINHQHKISSCFFYFKQKKKGVRIESCNANVMDYMTRLGMEREDRLDESAKEKEKEQKKEKEERGQEIKTNEKEAMYLYQMNNSICYVPCQLNKPLTSKFFVMEKTSNEKQKDKEEKLYSNWNEIDPLPLEMKETVLYQTIPLSVSSPFHTSIHNDSSSIDLWKDFLQYLCNSKYNRLSKDKQHWFMQLTRNSKNSKLPIWHDIKPLEWLRVQNGKVEFSQHWIKELSDEFHIQVQMWPGSMATAAIYHIHHQFIYQVEGSRRFIISPPNETSTWKPFPFAHPKHQSSQIPFEYYSIPFKEWGKKKNKPFSPGHKHIQGYQVTLHPGEMLYIPPCYWYSSMVVDTLSVSIHSYTLGFEEVMLSLSNPQMYPEFITNPDLDSEIQKDKVFMVGYFIRYLVDRVLKALPDPRDISNNEAGVLLNEMNEELEWDIVHSWIDTHVLNTKYQTNSMWSGMGCKHFDPTLCPLYGNTTQAMIQDMQSVAKTWALAYKQWSDFVSDKEDLYHIRNMFLSDHVEEIVGWIAGYSNTCYYLQCLTHGRFSSLYVASPEEVLDQRCRDRMKQQTQ
ncbi:HSPB (heat shock 27kDa) associated protein 1 [Reticulomyxa filosa]|uniref:HSPB (Heat shock 27kDa) associated protein 1 n=1 Tax=Reticulomyxa filosa TaxID=46433 RepID=X6PEW0_RETFI|nr:HSPB (heat shock 27kDa) associated protein 1 [Reticulomyxa filosa]|eukprot:ETO36643.1 HSPB (heat shock 27kDa) associated protein 1 [Reticulomyxa filosa]